jgi:hypothetical protein
MLEKLAGRLRWERSCDGIRVIIPLRFSWLSALGGIGFLALPQFTAEVFGRFRHGAGPASFAPEWTALCLVVVWFTMVFTTKQVLTLNPAELTIQARLFGIGVRKRSFATSRFHNLRFASAEYGLSMNDTNRIQIDRDFKTRNFAFGISELEADTLIDKMMDVYRFPKYPESGVAAPVAKN